MAVRLRSFASLRTTVSVCCVRTQREIGIPGENPRAVRFRMKRFEGSPGRHSEAQDKPALHGAKRRRRKPAPTIRGAGWLGDRICRGRRGYSSRLCWAWGWGSRDSRRWERRPSLQVDPFLKSSCSIESRLRSAMSGGIVLAGATPTPPPALTPWT